jgi:hypothetical protein
MTRLFVLGSGSKGNAFAVETSTGVVLVDAGFGLKAYRRRAERAGLALDRVIAVCSPTSMGTQGAQPGGGVRRRSCARWAGEASVGGWGGSQSGRRTRSPWPITVHSRLTTPTRISGLALTVEAPDGARLFRDRHRADDGGVRFLLRGANAVYGNYDDLLPDRTLSPQSAADCGLRRPRLQPGRGEPALDLCTRA